MLKVTVVMTGVLLGALALRGDESKSAKPAAKSVYEFTVKDIDGKEINLSKYKGDVLLIVNVASQCGLTEKSYAGLESIYKKYKDKGFKVLAFPANNFGGQEPGTNAEIKEFCASKHVSFDLFDKISVKGQDQAPLYSYLTKHPDKAVAGEVEWNFQKYLIGRDGNVIAKFSPKKFPEDKEITDAIEKALAEKP
jgi:glutathione peroxidase